MVRNKLIAAIIILFGLPILLATVSCTRIEPGYVGIKVHLTGGDKGIDNTPLETGRVWYNNFTQDVYKFPTFMQRAVWSQSEEEGEDKSITFNSKEGTPVNVDVAANYTFRKDKITKIFAELRSDADVIKDTFIRDKVRDAFVREGGKMKVIDIFGEGKQTLLDGVMKTVNEKLGKDFDFDMISIIGDLRVDEKVTESINATISATQRAVEAENKVMQSKAEADQKIEDARGKAESITLVAKAKADANRMLTESLSTNLLVYEALQIWDGRLPLVVGENATVPVMNLPEVAAATAKTKDSDTVNVEE